MRSYELLADEWARRRVPATSVAEPVRTPWAVEAEPVQALAELINVTIADVERLSAPARDEAAGRTCSAPWPSPTERSGNPDLNRQVFQVTVAT